MSAILPWNYTYIELYYICCRFNGQYTIIAGTVLSARAFLLCGKSSFLSKFIYLMKMTHQLMETTIIFYFTCSM